MSLCESVLVSTELSLNSYMPRTAPVIISAICPQNVKPPLTVNICIN